MATVTVHSPRCNSYKVYHYDHSTSNHKRPVLILQTCVFQLNYIYETRKPDIKEQIVEMVHNGVGVRDSSRTLKVDINPVILTL